MNAFKTNFRNQFLLSLVFILFLNLPSSASSFEEEKSIQEMVGNLSPSVSFSFSKNILDFFDTDLDWKDSKKHLEGDFSKAAFYTFDNATNNETLTNLFKDKGYSLIRIDDKDDDSNEVRLFVNQTGKEVKEAHFIIEGDDNLIVFSLYGKMRLKELK
jgi:hypothetical protein